MTGFLYTRFYCLVLSLLFFLSVHPEYFVFADFFNQKRLLQLAALIGTLPLVFSPPYRNRLIVLARQFKIVSSLISLFFCLGFFSVLAAQEPAIAIQEWLHTLSLAVFVLVVSLIFIVDSTGLRLALIASIGTVGLYIFKFFVIYVAAYLGGTTLQASVVLPGFVNRNFIAQFMAMFVPFLVLFVPRSLGHKSILAFVFSVLFVFFLLVADVRGVLVSLAFVSLLALLLPNAGRRYFVSYLVVFVTALVLFLLTYVLRGEGGQLIAQPLSSSGRSFHWHNAFQLWLENPLLGAGPAAYSYLVDTSIAHPHNLYLQILSEWGALALLCLIGVFFLSIGHVIRSFKRWSVLNTGLFLALVQGLLHAGVSGVLVMPLSQVVFCVLLACYISEAARSAEIREPETKLKTWPSIILSILSALVLVLMVAVVYFNNPYSDMLDNCVVKVGPRFWVDGGVLPNESCP